MRIYSAKNDLLFQSDTVRNAPADLRVDVKLPATKDVSQPVAEFVVRGQVRLADGTPLVGALVRVYDKDLRKRKFLGEMSTGHEGSYEIRYSARDFCRAEKGTADLVIEAIAADQSLLAASPVLFNAPPSANVDLLIPAEKWQPPTLFEKIGRALVPLLDGLKVEALEEDKEHQDLSFLSGETGFEKHILARFVIAHNLAQHGIQPEFWFALLGGSFFGFDENKSLEEQAAAILDSLSSLDAAAVRKSLNRALDQKDIPDAFREKVADWIEAFLSFAARRSLNGAAKPGFARLALEHAGIKDSEKQEKFARLLNEHRTLTPQLVSSLESDSSFKREEIDDLRTSFQLSDLTHGNFSVVQMLKDEFDVREPEKIRKLAKKSASEWVALVKEKHAAGDIELPMSDVPGPISLPAAEVYGKTLERRFREAYPTTAFAGGLERALVNGGAHGLRNAKTLHRFLERHEDFDFLTTRVDDFF